MIYAILARIFCRGLHDFCVEKIETKIVSAEKKGLISFMNLKQNHKNSVTIEYTPLCIFAKKKSSSAVKDQIKAAQLLHTLPLQSYIEVSKNWTSNKQLE